MSVSEHSVNPVWFSRSYLIECCDEDSSRVEPIVNSMRAMGLRVSTCRGMNDIQRFDQIKAHDVIIFFISKNLLRVTPFEMNRDYQCCQDYGKTPQFAYWDNPNTVTPRAIPTTEAYAFWTKITAIHGIYLKPSLSDIEKARDILNAIDNPQQLTATSPIIKYIPMVLLAAAVVMYLLAVFKDKLPLSPGSEGTQPALSLSQLGTAQNLAVGRHVTFGSYEQDGSTVNGSEAIVWRVLAKDGDKVLLISDKLLDYVPYNDEDKAVTWSECSLRRWLNNDFYHAAFTSQEQGRITVSHHENAGGRSTNDRIFALSSSEAQQYFSSNADMAAYTTDFARQQGRSLSGNGKDYWWLRTPAQNGNSAMDVAAEGGIVPQGNSVTNDQVAVRPAMWVTVE